MDTAPANRAAPLEMTSDEFRRLGHLLVDRVADFLGSLRARPVTPGETPTQVREAVDSGRGLPEGGADPQALLLKAADLLFDHSLFNGHPRFWGYITSSAAPIGALAEMLAAAVNSNVGAWFLSPVASEIEAQTVRWIAEMIGFPTDCGGLLVSGGNMANFVCVVAARQAKAGWDVRAAGFSGAGKRLRVYASKETHTWLQKAADLLGLGTEAVRWIATDDRLRIDIANLREQIEQDVAAGERPFLVVGTAGSVSTGAVDCLAEIAAVCRQYDLWFHVDGAYGGFAVLSPDAPPELAAMSGADSVAVDPHKWLYAPLEAGCALVRDPSKLREAFSYHPPYYHFGVEAINYLDYGPQNSRGFRALKVWLGLQQVGRDGYRQMISDDIRLAQALYRCVAAHPALEALTRDLSIVTFRYVPPELPGNLVERDSYLNDLNTEVLTRLQNSGTAYVSNAIIGGRFVLRACIVNFRTSLADVEALPEMVAQIGREADEALRPTTLRR